MREFKHWKEYGTVRGAIVNAGEGVADLMVVANTDPDDLYPKSRIVIGSTKGSDADVGLSVSYHKAGKLIALLEQARADIVAACPAATEPDEDDR